MKKTCNGCGAEDIKVSVPYIVHEEANARHERYAKRIWIALLVAVGMLFASNAFWLLAWLQYDYTSTTTTEEIILDGGEGGNANYIGQDGNIYNGENNNPKNNDNQIPNEEKQ